MPQYFIDTDDGECVVRDEEGITLDDVEAARKLALDTLAKIACGQPSPTGAVKVTVRDDRGTVGELHLTSSGRWS